MSTHPCCAKDTPPHPHSSRWRCGGEVAGWLLPSAMLVLLPKCPACIVACVALFSGVGISVAGASYLRASLLVLCIATLLCLALQRLCRQISPRMKSPPKSRCRTAKAPANFEAPA